MGSPPPPPPRSRTVSPAPHKQEDHNEELYQILKDVQSLESSLTDEKSEQQEQQQIKLQEKEESNVQFQKEEENKDIEVYQQEVKVDENEEGPEASRRKLRQQIEQQLKQRYQQMQLQQQQEELQEKEQQKQQKALEEQKQQLKTQMQGKSQGEQLRLELQQRLLQRQQQLEEQEQKQNKHKHKQSKQGSAPPGSLPTKSGPPPPPRRNSSLSNPSSPLCTSLASSRDVSRSSSPTLPPPPPPPPQRSVPLSRPTSRPPSRPTSRPPSRPSSTPPSPPSPENPLMAKLKGLPQVLPPGIPPTLKKSPLGASLAEGKSVSEVLSKQTDLAQNTTFSNILSKSDSIQQTSNASNILNEKETQVKNVSSELHKLPILHHSPEESGNSMSISWPIQPVPTTQIGEFVKISTQKEGPFTQISNHYSNNYSSLGIGKAFDSSNRSFSPVNNTFTQSGSMSTDNSSNFRSFSPVSFNLLADQAQSQHSTYITNPMNQLGSSGSSTFKNNPGMAHRVYVSEQDVSLDYTGYCKKFEGSNNIQDGRKTIGGYFKHGSKSGSTDLKGIVRSSESNDAFGIVTSDTNNLIGSRASIEANDGKELTIRAHNFNIKEHLRTDLNLHDMNIRETADMNIKDMNIALDSSSDNGNDNTAPDMDQTSDSIQADVCESVDSIGGAPCRNPSCNRVGDTEVNLVKSCHNCGTVYCSRVCRRSHWEKHKKLCQKIRANNATKEIIAMVRDREISLDAASAVGRRGALGLGRGVVKMFFPDIPSSESFIEGNYTPSMHYHTAQNLMPNEMCPDVYRQLIEMCRLYNSDHKFILYVSICVNNEVTTGPSKCRRENVSRAAKIKLFDPLKRVITNKLPTTTFKDDIKDSIPRPPKESGMRLLTFAPDTKDGSGNINRQKTPTAPSMKLPGFGGYDESSEKENEDSSAMQETLILTPVETLNVSVRETRQIIFQNILRHLRERNILLRTQYPDVYRKLSIYADVGETFPPLTIYPKDSDTGATLVCVIMPEPDQNKVRKIASESEIVRKIDITKPPKN